eukprot:61649-Pyramimonas_sp.AAC.1
MDALASLAIAARQANKANDSIIAELACLKFMVNGIEKASTQIGRFRQTKDTITDILSNTRKRFHKLHNEEAQFAAWLESIQANIAEARELEHFEREEDDDMDGDWIGVGTFAAGAAAGVPGAQQGAPPPPPAPQPQPAQT